jgi:3-hydroxy-9,10-secoandrosta-1,3,5(10)-triene-9,17-dione monooxygenase reductase component
VPIAAKIKPDHRPGLRHWQCAQREKPVAPARRLRQRMIRSREYSDAAANSEGQQGKSRVIDTTIDPNIFRQVLGSYPTGVCVITALDTENRPTGMVVGTFTSVSLDPPLVGFLPDKKSTSWPVIEQAGRFCVNVLASDQQQVCRQVAAKGPEKFVGVDYAISGHGLPVLANAIARIECEIQSVTDAGDHYFVLGNVLGLEMTRDEDPMLFHRGRYGGFAEIA